MIGLLSPTIFISEAGKVNAQSLPKLLISANLPAPVSARSESFLVSSSKFQVPSQLAAVSTFSNTIIGSAMSSDVGLFASDPENISSLIPYPSSLLSQPAGSVDFDFDGDGKADLARWHVSNTEWKVKNSSSGSFTTTTIGSSSSIIAPGRFDTDSKTDAAVFSAGTWTIKKSTDNSTYTVNFGTTGDKPVASDYDGDGKADAAVFRPSTNTWWILQSSNGNYTSTAFGNSGDITAQGNYDGDSKTDIAVFRPSTGDWHVLGSSAGYFSFHWGIATDIPVPADYDGDGKTDFAVYRGSSGTWYVSKSSTNNAQYVTQVWGNYGDQPVPADTDGDNKADYSVWRPTTGVWHTIKSSNGGYDYQTLGQSGDTAVTSAYLKQIGGAVAGYDLAKARLSPKNSTGGTDLYSRNFSWGTGLVGLSGRAGMGAGFGISYNSLVWTKETESNSIYFDADTSNVSPGFRFGFPTIEPVYWDKDAQKFNYLMVTPSGARVEFRQIGASDTYETADSSYIQLKTNGASNPNDPVENISITLSGTDGSKMTYLWKAGAFRCSLIKDRNGNFNTINHDAQGLLQTVTDTLGRVITVNYDNELDPTTITQTWKTGNGSGSNVTYTWATFNYTTATISTNFASGINIVGPVNGTSLKVLQKITFPSGGYTTFDYNGYGQVKQINNYAADWHLLNYTKTNLDNPATNQTDCPRFSETRNWVENFNQNTSGIAQETVVTNTITENQTYNVGGISGTATKIEVSMEGDPYNHVSKTFVGSSGWMESLPIASEDWANGTSGQERKRWTWTNWTQDDTNASYIQNPRTTVSKVGDTTNIKKTETEYYPVSANSPVALYGLVKEVRVYDTDQTTVLKKAVTEYNLDNAYLSRRIIGLPSKTELYGLETSGLNLMSKVTYEYDEGDFSDSNLAQNISTAIQHDNTNFSSGLTTGRGNLTSTTRWNVAYPTTSGEAVSSSVKYNTAGAPVAQTDPLGRTVKIEYTDAFNDNQNRNTFAYPTKLTDPANNYSEVKYRFDIGTNVWAKSPAPAGNSIGKETIRLYDSIGRLDKEMLVNTGAYTRYEYPTNQIQSKVYSTVIDTNNNGADSNDEVMSESWTDGAGRVRKSRTEHPNSTGGWTGSLAEYDIFGQVKRSTVPTEINSSYEPAGDDATRGWLWSSQEYDWKGRVTKTINTDATERLISYIGCGCAGGQITTIQGESVPVPGQTNTFARRTQKVYEDILGRTYQTESLNWDGSVYSTIKTTFNGRDQATEVKQYQGADTSSTFQTTTATFDGHGRLKTQHRPEQQNANGTPTFTNYNYNLDDSISSIVDARTATTSYVYNDSRGLLTNINYSPPANSTIPAGANVSFTYDTLGNRISMTDGLGNVSYEYNQLSQMKAEMRTFSDSLPDAPTTNNGKYRIEYGYTLSGQLKSLKDPFGQENTYSFDKIGRVNKVDSSGYGDLPQSQPVVSGMQYRAFGSLKQADYGNGTQTTMQYNDRLQPSNYRLKNGSQILFGKDYYYTTGTNNDNDGLVKRSVHYDDTLSSTERSKHNRTNTFDAFSRNTSSVSGEYGVTPVQFGTEITHGPFQVSYSYDTFNNLIAINDRDFETNVVGCVGCPRSTNSSETFVNNRTTSSSYSVGGYGGGISLYEYDQDGRLTKRGDELYQYNAAGQRISADMTGTTPDPAYVYDGDGKLVKLSENGTVKNYYIISSVLNVTVSELTSTGALDKGYMLSPTGARITLMKDSEVKFVHNEPSGADEYIFKVDKTNVGRTIYEPIGRPASNPGYTGGGPCGNNCPGGYNPPGGFDGLAILKSRRTQERWQDSAFWNLQDYINNFIIVGSTPPNGWDRYHDNRNPRTDNFHRGGTWVGGLQVSLRNVGERHGAFWLVYYYQTSEYYIPTDKELKDRLIERLNDGGCRAFLDKVRADRKINKTFERLLDDALKKGPKNKKGILYDPNQANVETSSTGKYDQLTLKPQPRDKDLNPAFLLMRLDNYVTLTIHGLVHRAGVEAHENFAVAAYNALTDSEEKDNPRPLRGDFKGNDAFDVANSDYFQKILRQKCPGVSQPKN